MSQDVSFDLVSATITKDATGQSVPGKPKNTTCIGSLDSVYQNEFYQAEQAGIRAQGVITMNRAEFDGQKILSINGQNYTIYRTYERDADWIELHYGERVGNG